MQLPSLHFLRPRRLLLVGLLVALIGASWVEPAFAHNEFESSNPVGGAVLEVAPAEILIVFVNAVPLDTATVQVIDATGVRANAPLSHGALGQREVIATLPPLAPGEVTVRWRLVGADGHVISDRITFTVAPAVATDPASDPQSPPTPAVTPQSTADASEGFTAPAALRWMMRYLSYLALLVVVAISLADVFVWPGCASAAPLARLVSASLATVAALAVAQFLVLAADIHGVGTGSWPSTVQVAGGTLVGAALILRVVLAGVAWVLLRRMSIVHADVRWVATALVGTAMLATWSAAGHAATRRVPQIGVAVDVAHHAAAGFWIGSLALVGLVAARRLEPAALGVVVRRLSRAAAVAVAVVAGSGLVQALRLVDEPSRLFDSRHGVLLAAKIVVFGLILLLAARNRRLVIAQFAGPSAPDTSSVSALRQTIVVEVALGLLVFAITSSLVVAPPGG